VEGCGILNLRRGRPVPDIYIRCGLHFLRCHSSRLQRLRLFLIGHHFDLLAAAAGGDCAFHLYYGGGGESSSPAGRVGKNPLAASVMAFRRLLFGYTFRRLCACSRAGGADDAGVGCLRVGRGCVAGQGL